MSVFSNEQSVPSQRQGRAGQLSFPRHVVTAVLVTHDGARWLDGVLTGLFNQRRPVQQVVAVDTGSRDGSLDIIRSALGPDNVLERKRSTGYGAAVSYGLKASPPVAYDEYGYHNDGRGPVEWIWLLHDDSEPATDALLHMLAVADDDPDVAVIGPKVRGWYDREQLLEAGVTLTSNGVRWTGLERNEHDQGQHDDVRPVLAVGSAGMLVRRDVWDRLRGFDPALSLFRDDVDFCWRAHSAGYRVVRAPRAIVYHAEAAARERRRIHAGVDRPHLLDRRNALYTLLVNRGRRGALLAYLRLLFTSLVRVLALLVGKQAGRASDEFVAMIAFATRIDRVLRGRRHRKRLRVVSDDELADLFPSRGAVARVTYDTVLLNLRGDRAEADPGAGGRRRSVESGPVSEDAESLETDDGGWLSRLLRQPGLLVFVGLTVVALFACRNLLNGGSLLGGALLPAPEGASDMWSKFVAAWHPIGDGSNTSSPPYLAVIAMLSTVLFGKPDAALDVLLLGSVPLAGLSAYYAARRVVASRLLRMWGAAAYALLPVATGAIAAGRVGVTTAMILVPLIVAGAASAIGGPGRAGSTRSAWTTALGIAVATAFAPVAWVVAALCGLVALLTVAWRARANLIVVVIRFAIMFVSPLVVLEPWSLGLLRNPSMFFVDAGLQGATLTEPRPSGVGYLLGSPGGPGVYPAWISAGLLLAALAALLRTSRRRIAVAGWAVALSGFAIGLAMLHSSVTPPTGDGTVVPWPGVPAAFFGFGLIIAALIGAEGARERVGASSFGWRQPAAVLVTVAAGVAPVIVAGWWLVRGADGPLTRGTPQLLPDYVAAEATTAPTSPRTLMLGVGADGQLSYGVVRAEGATLGDADTQPTRGQTANLDSLVGDLLSGAGGGVAQTLAEHDVQYIVTTQAAAGQVADVLNNTDGLVRLSSASGDELWQVSVPASRLLIQTPNSLTALPTTTSKTYSVTATVPAGGSGRVLLVSESAGSHWTATLDGQSLTPTTVNGWQQAFELPASGGTLTVEYRDSAHTVELFVELALVLILLVMALPTGRRPDDAEGEEEAERAAAGKTAPAPGGAAAPEPAAVEPEPEPEPAETGIESPAEPEPAYAETGYRSYPEYDARGYGGYQQEPATYENAGYDANAYGYPADPYAAEGRPYAEPQAYQEPDPAAHPRAYGAPPAPEAYPAEQYPADQYPAEHYATEQYPADQYRGYGAPDGYQQPEQYQHTEPYQHQQQPDPYAGWEATYPPQPAEEQQQYYYGDDRYEEDGR